MCFNFEQEKLYMMMRLFATCLFFSLYSIGIAQETSDVEMATEQTAQSNDSEGTSIVETNQTSTTEGIVNAPDNGSSTQTTEAGAYEKNSVTYINKLWSIDNSTDELKDEEKKLLLNAIQTQLVSKRFDYNPVSEEFVSELSNCMSEDT